jgi:hypothetical protein
MGTQHDISLSTGDAFAIEHVRGFVTSVWPGRDGTSWVEVRERDGRDRLCHLLVALPLEEEQVDEVSLTLGGRDGATALAWTVWRRDQHGTAPGLLAAACGANKRPRSDPGVLGVVRQKLFSTLPAKAAQLEAELGAKLLSLLDAPRTARAA